MIVVVLYSVVDGIWAIVAKTVPVHCILQSIALILYPVPVRSISPINDRQVFSGSSTGGCCKVSIQLVFSDQTHHTVQEIVYST
jgi:hypothetical protein